MREIETLHHWRIAHIHPSILWAVKSYCLTGIVEKERKDDEPERIWAHTSGISVADYPRDDLHKGLPVPTKNGRTFILGERL